jgi:hypothetical protein
MIAVLEMRRFSFSKSRLRRTPRKFDGGDAATLLCGVLIFGIVLCASLELLPFKFSQPEQ